MRQFLMLVFYCKVYRREPACRVYINNVLIDEFNIPHTPLQDTFISEKILDPAFLSYEQYKLQLNPPFIKLLELDDADQRFLDLKVEIQNDDNNYTNGFMTRYTQVMLCQCCLAPVKVLDQWDRILEPWKYSLHNWYRWQGVTKSVSHYYSGRRNYVFDNLAKYADMHFKDITQQLLSKEQLKLNVSNYQTLSQMWQVNPSDHWTGSSGYFHLTLAKKLGFWRHSTDRRRGWWKLSMINNMTDIYDKYKQYEDTRSIDQ